MVTPSVGVTVAFVVLVLGLASLFVHAVAVGAAPRGESSGATWRWRWVAILIGLLWLVPPALAARAGVLGRFDTMPPPLLIMMATLTLGTVLVALSPLGTRLVQGLSLAWLVGFQAFRIPVELILHRLFTEGVIPVQMTYAGFNFDIVSGILAALLAGVLARRRVPGWLVMSWNILGLVLLGTIVAIALFSAPVPFRRFMNEPANLLPAVFPWVWLPTLLVMGALFGHVLVFRKLATRER